MKFDFESVPDRKYTGSYKWVCTEKGGECEGAFPLSTADMEWGTAPEIRKACAEFAMKGIYGYTIPDELYRKTVCDFMLRRHDWHIEPDWIITTYGIVSAIHTCVRAFTKEGDGVIIQQPVYGHFEAAVTLNNRKAVNNSLLLRDGKFEMNFEELEKLCRDENNKMLILCSPHNPVGRVWKKEELEKVVRLCYENNVIIIADEIHFDIVTAKHTVLASLSPEASSITVTCTAPSKSFNIAGLGTSNIIISDEKLRNTFADRIGKDGYECINAFAYPAIIAAYTKCDDWLDEMNANIKSNYEFLKSYIDENMPAVKYFDLEGTYLVWLDVSCLGVSDEEIVGYFADNAGVVPNSGGWFGKEGLGFIRLNIAVPKSALEACLCRMKKLFENK